MNLPVRLNKLETKLLVSVQCVAPLPLKSPEDVLALLAEQVNLARADVGADPQEKARTLGMLASLALRAIEARDYAARLEAIEGVLKLRKAQESKTKEKRSWRSPA